MQLGLGLLCLLRLLPLGNRLLDLLCPLGSRLLGLLCPLGSRLLGLLPLGSRLLGLLASLLHKLGSLLLGLLGSPLLGSRLLGLLLLVNLQRRFGGARDLHGRTAQLFFDQRLERALAFAVCDLCATEDTLHHLAFGKSLVLTCDDGLLGLCFPHPQCG